MIDRAAIPDTSKTEDSPLTYWKARAVEYLELLRRVRDCGQPLGGTRLMEQIREVTRGLAKHGPSP